MQVLPLGLMQVGQGVNRLPAVSSRRWWHLPLAEMPEVHERIDRFWHASWHRCWNCCSDSGHLQTQTAVVSLAETWIVSALGWWMQKLMAWLSMTMPNLIVRKASPDCQPANRLYSIGAWANYYMDRDGMARGSAHVMFLLCCLAVVSISVKWWRCARCDRQTRGRDIHKQHVLVISLCLCPLPNSQYTELASML